MKVMVITLVPILAVVALILVNEGDDSLTDRLSMLAYDNKVLNSRMDKLESQLSELKDRVDVIENRGDGIENRRDVIGSLSTGIYTDLTSMNDNNYKVVPHVNEILASNVELMNKRFILPYEISVSTADCDAAAYYSYKSKSIVICSSTLDYLSRYTDRVEDLEAIDKNIRFILYHEAAHMLIDVYGIPVIGREESAADTFAIMTMLEYDGYESIEHVIRFYDVVREDRHVIASISMKYWDEHMLFAQTYYDMLCLTYGKYDIVSYRELLHDRAESCRYEYLRQKQALEELFGKYIRG